MSESINLCCDRKPGACAVGRYEAGRIAYNCRNSIFVKAVSDFGPGNCRLAPQGGLNRPLIDPMVRLNPGHQAA